MIGKAFGYNFVNDSTKRDRSEICHGCDFFFFLYKDNKCFVYLRRKISRFKPCNTKVEKLRSTQNAFFFFEKAGFEPLGLGDLLESI